jgi:hypothetical protein
MKDAPLLTITKIIDAEMSHEVNDVGSLDYRVHCQELENWLAAGAGRREQQTVRERQAMFAKELRSLADAMEQGANPFTVTIEYAEKKAAERRASLAEWLRKNEMRSLP